MPYRDILDFLEVLQGQPDVIGLDAIGARAIQRSVGKLDHRGDAAIGLPFRDVEKDAAGLIRSSELPQPLDLRKPQLQGCEEL